MTRHVMGLALLYALLVLLAPADAEGAAFNGAAAQLHAPPILGLLLPLVTLPDIPLPVTVRPY